MFKYSMILSVLVALIFPCYSIASNEGGDKKAQSATVYCGGNHAFSRSNSQAHRSMYVLRNISDHQSISINRIRFYGADGNLLADYIAPDLPVFINAVLGGGDTILAPHETAQLRSQEVFGDSRISRRLRPMQMRIDWSSDEDVLTLQVNHIRSTRQAYEDFDPITGATTLVIGPETSRHNSSCRTVKTD